MPAHSTPLHLFCWWVVACRAWHGSVPSHTNLDLVNPSTSVQGCPPQKKCRELPKGSNQPRGHSTRGLLSPFQIPRMMGTRRICRLFLEQLAAPERLQSLSFDGLLDFAITQRQKTWQNTQSRFQSEVHNHLFFSSCTVSGCTLSGGSWFKSNGYHYSRSDCSNGASGPRSGFGGWISCTSDAGSGSNHCAIGGGGQRVKHYPHQQLDWLSHGGPRSRPLPQHPNQHYI